MDLPMGMLVLITKLPAYAKIEERGYANLPDTFLATVHKTATRREWIHVKFDDDVWCFRWNSGLAKDNEVLVMPADNIE